LFVGWTRSAEGMVVRVSAIDVMPALSDRDVLLVDAVALRVVELLDERALRPREPHDQLVDAQGLADALGVARSFVYRHSGMLGAVRLGDGPRAPVRFDIETAREAISCWHSRRSPDQTADKHGGNGPSRRGRGRRLPNGLPEPGQILRSRP
jgi:hypothetical protein